MRGRTGGGWARDLSVGGSPPLIGPWRPDVGIAGLIPRPGPAAGRAAAVRPPAKSGAGELPRSDWPKPCIRESTENAALTVYRFRE